MDSNFKESNCGLCRSTYDAKLNQPRLIPVCGHTICTECVRNMLERISIRGTFVCPFDRKEYRLEDKSLDSFPANYELI
jgi:hypothetical protein